MPDLVPAPSPFVLRIADVTKRFGALVANDAISLDLHAGEILALLGENGAGKTTLMNILFGHYTADEGSILIAAADGAPEPLPPGRPGAALAAGIGMVHQHFALAEGLTVLDNVVLGTRPALVAVAASRRGTGAARPAHGRERARDRPGPARRRPHASARSSASRF